MTRLGAPPSGRLDGIALQVDWRSAWLSEAEPRQAAGDAEGDEPQRLPAELFASPFHGFDRKSELASWQRPDLAQAAVEQGIVASISGTTI